MGKKRKRRRSKNWFQRNIGYLSLAVVAVVALTLVVFALNRPAVVTAEPAPIPTFAGTTKPLVTIIGDSYTDGSGMNTGPETLWPVLIRDTAGIRTAALAVGGSGYVTVNPAISDDTFVTSAGKVQEDSDVVVFFGSRNDGQGYTAIRAAATQAFANASTAAPGSKVLAIGPAWVDANPPAEIIDARNAIRDAAVAAGIPFTDAIGWFNDDDGTLIGDDGIHPTDAGHRHLAELISPLIVAALAG